MAAMMTAMLVGHDQHRPSKKLSTLQSYLYLPQGVESKPSHVFTSEDGPRHHPRLASVVSALLFPKVNDIQNSEKNTSTLVEPRLAPPLMRLTGSTPHVAAALVPSLPPHAPPRIPAPSRAPNGPGCGLRGARWGVGASRPTRCRRVEM